MKSVFSLVLLAAFAALASDLPCTFVPDRKPTGEKGPQEPFVNTLGMKFVWIPPGTFFMGSPQKEDARDANEAQHGVTLTKGFYMGVHLVTQEQWQVVIGDNHSRFKNEKNLPIDTVSWDDCQEFLQKLNKRDKRRYRLPTEAEFEYACRAGTTTPFHFGETITTDQVNHNGNDTYRTGHKSVYRERPTPVGAFPANAWGLHDMHGNLFQWCQDWYGDYPQQGVIDPKGPEKGDERVLRGGSWASNPECCRSASRYRQEPDLPKNNFGFRVIYCLE